MGSLAIGIDLGTSTSEIAAFRYGEPSPLADPGTKHAIVPSLIAVNRKGNLLVGEEARQFVDVPGHGAREFKRLMGAGETVVMGDTTYRPEELSALLLAKLKQNAETALGEPITDVVLSVPANFNDAAKQATLNAAQLAGLQVVQLVNEPTAAALSFGIRHIDAEAQIVVFDFGGGTLDVSTLEMMEGVLEVRASFGDTKLGGKDFDDAMIGLILSKFYAQHGQRPLSDLAKSSLKATAEKAKIALSEYPSYAIFLPRFTDDLDLDLEVTREEFETEVAPLLERARQCLNAALSAGKFRPNAIDTVLLVGGTTYIPCVRAIVEAFFHKPIKPQVHPDLAVALGSATLAGIRNGLVNARDSLVFSDVCSMGIGIGVISEIGGQQMLTYKSLIQPNTQIPFSCRYPMQLMRPDQDQAEFNVFQTHLDDDSYPLHLGIARKLIDDVGLSGRITDIPPSFNDNPHPIIIDFSYDRNGIVNIHAAIPTVQKSADVQFAQSALRMDTTDLHAAQLRVRELLGGVSLLPATAMSPTEERWSESHEINHRYAPLITRVEQIAARHPKEAEQIEQAITMLRSALSIGNSQTINLAGDALTNLLFTILE